MNALNSKMTYYLLFVLMMLSGVVLAHSEPPQSDAQEYQKNRAEYLKSQREQGYDVPAPPEVENLSGETSARVRACMPTPPAGWSVVKNEKSDQALKVEQNEVSTVTQIYLKGSQQIEVLAMENANLAHSLRGMIASGMTPDKMIPGMQKYKDKYIKFEDNGMSVWLLEQGIVLNISGDNMTRNQGLLFVDHIGS